MSVERYRIRLDAPAARPVDGFLLGDGRLGAAVHGGIGTERFDLGLASLWSGGPIDDDVKTPVGLIGPLRAAIAAGDSPTVERLAAAMQRGRRATPQPLGVMRWRYTADPVAEVPYSRTIDLARAISTTRVGRGQLDCFVSSRDAVLLADWMGPSGDSSGELSGVEVSCPHPSQQRRWRDQGCLWMSLTGRVPGGGDRDLDPVPDDPDGAGQVSAGMAFAVVAATQASPSGARLVAAAQTGFLGALKRPLGDPRSLVAAAQSRVSAALALDSELLARRHVAEYAALFDRLDLRLDGGDEAARDELLFHLGRSLLITGIGQPEAGGHSAGETEAHSVFPATGALWAGVKGASGETGTTDPEVPSPDTPHPDESNPDHDEMDVGEVDALGLDQLGLGELIAPVATAITELVTSGRDSAASIYGFHGAGVSGAPDLWRRAAPAIGEVSRANWPGTLMALVDVLYVHARHGGDRVTALTAYREVIRFLLDLLVNGPDGRLVPSPSALPGSLRLGPDGRLAAVGFGSALDLSVAAQCLERYVELAGQQPDEPDAQLVERCRAALGSLAPIPISGGVLQDWTAPGRSADGGSGGLYSLHGVFPGVTISRRRDPELANAARRALLRHGERWNHEPPVAWEQVRGLALAARLGLPELAGRCLERLAAGCLSRSLLAMTPGPASGIPRLSVRSAMALPFAMIQQLVQVGDGVISLMPIVPARWPRGELAGLMIPGGHSLTMSWAKGTVQTVTLHARRHDTFAVDLPRGEAELSSSDGRVPDLVKVAGSDPERMLLSFPAVESLDYTISLR